MSASEPPHNSAARRLLRPPRQRGARVVYWLLVAVIVLLALFMVLAQKPWDAGLMSSIEKRTSAGKSWKTEHYIAVYEWLAAAVNLLIATGLLLTLKAWMRPLDGGGVAPGSDAPGAARATVPWLMVGLAIAMLLGAYFRIQRLDHSLWSDEEYTVRTHIWGQMAEVDGGGLRYEPVPWRDTFFRNKLNNHLGYTIPTKLLHDAWARFGASAGHPFSEPVLRLLPLLASLASIALLGILVARYTDPITGLGAAFFLAINPWHLRYSVEARGYAAAIFFLLLAFLFLIPAIRGGRWRDWALFAAAELSALLCVPGIVYVLVISNAAAIALIFLRHGGRPLRARVTIACRMLVANLFAAMVFIQLIAPSVPQIVEYLRTDHFMGQMTLAWWREVWTLFTSGLPASDLSPGQHLGSSFMAEAERLPGLRAFHRIGLLALACIGLLAALRQRSWLLLPCLAAIGGAVIVFVESQMMEKSIHPWYVIHVIIGLIIFIVFGLRSVAGGLRAVLPGRAAAAGPALVSALFLCLYFVSTIHGRQLLCQFPRHPIREVVAAVRGDRAYSDDDGGLITASFGTSKGMITSYDPRNRILKGPASLRALIAEAKAAGKELVVYHCGLERARESEPAMVALVEDPALFEEQLPAVLGLEELFSYHIYRYVGP